MRLLLDPSTVYGRRVDTLTALKAFANGTGDLATLRAIALDDPTAIGSRALMFLTEYENHDWTVGETRNRAAKVIRDLEA